MNLNVSGAFIYFTIPIFGGIPITQTTVSSIIITIVLCALCVKLGKNLQKRPTGVQVLVEKGVTMLNDMVRESMGEHNLHWAPFIGTIFLSSMFGSFIGLTGFLRSMTADLSCTLVWSVMVSVIIWYNNIKNNGLVGWLKGFTEPIVVMTPMNIVGEIAQPASMAFRHFGNIAGGGVITSILYLAMSLLSTLVLDLVAGGGVLVPIVLTAAGAGLIFLYAKKAKKKRFLIPGILCFVIGVFGILEATGILVGVPFLSFGIPAVLSCYFDIFSGFVQAYVFTLLTMVYIGNSCPAPETNEAVQ